MSPRYVVKKNDPRTNPQMVSKQCHDGPYDEHAYSETDSTPRTISECGPKGDIPPRSQDPVMYGGKDDGVYDP